jgi:hypothetical protein
MKETIRLISEVIETISKGYSDNFAPENENMKPVDDNPATSNAQSGSISNVASTLSLHVRSTENFMKISDLEEKFKGIDDKICDIYQNFYSNNNSNAMSNK